MTNHPNRARIGRPPMSPETKAVAIKITLTPAALERLDRLGGTRSGAIERLISNAVT